MSSLRPSLSAEVQRAEAAALVAVLPADDDEFLALDAFDLEPVAWCARRDRARSAFFEMMPSPPSSQIASNNASPLPMTWSP